MAEAERLVVGGDAFSVYFGNSGNAVHQDAFDTGFQSHARSSASDTGTREFDIDDAGLFINSHEGNIATIHLDDGPDCFDRFFNCLFHDQDLFCMQTSRGAGPRIPLCHGKRPIPEKPSGTSAFSPFHFRIVLVTMELRRKTLIFFLWGFLVLPFFIFVVVMFAASVALLFNHVIGLRNRVELNASGLRVQQNRLALLEDELVDSTTDKERLEAEHDIASCRARVEMSADLHRAAYEAYNKTMNNFPGSLLKAHAVLSSSAMNVQPIQPMAVLDLTDSGIKALTLSPSVVQLP